VGKGQSYLHDRGIVHRDLKPGNIFYEDGYVKIGDYGLAKLMAASQHSGQTVSVGTVHYMAPEVGSGNYDRTIDIYALGVMLYEMLLGRVPFSGATMGEVLMKHLTAQPQVDELPQPFPRVIRKALAKDPKDRYQTVQEMLNAVFEVEDIHRSVANIDSLSLTRMAAAVMKKVQLGAPVGVRVGGGPGEGSSNISAMAATRTGPGVRVEPGGIPPIPRFDAYDASPRKKPKKPRPIPCGAFPQRKRLTTGLLGIFLGSFGVHRFYTGYNGIGFCQFLASIFTGIGALWGPIEGLMILLNGQFRDALDRPLLEHEVAWRPGTRNLFVRIAWSILGAALFAGTCGLVVAGTFAGPDIEIFDTTGIDGEKHAFDAFHFLYMVAAVTAGFCAFALWKASHRGGLPFWRSTTRPALMCGFLALTAAAFAFERFIAPPAAQAFGIVVMGVFALSFMTLWFLRGPTPTGIFGDIYWPRATTILFTLIAVVALLGSVLTFKNWKSASRQWRMESDTTRVVAIAEYDFDPKIQKFVQRESELPAQYSAFNHLPIASGLLAMLAVGSMGEARYRRRLVRKIMDTAPHTRAAGY
jgi:hypothetical protein